MGTHNVSEPSIQRDWLILDAREAVLGRLASEAASILRGKKKVIYSPHLDTGDHVIVINADQVRVSGKKREKKKYFRHSMYPGGVRWTPFEEMLEDKPTEIIRLAVKGMLPKNRLGRAMIKKLKIYTGDKHPHEAQMPKAHALDKVGGH
ncbi:MAG: 50S ribosomal protein L13 [Candidatus Eisenbacteria bacterium]|nr:50S ribosomal protein L13 [Candidatus Eisenbacteria bacterium]